MFPVVKLLSEASRESCFGEVSFIQINFVHQQILSTSDSVHCKAKRDEHQLWERIDFISETTEWVMIKFGCTESRFLSHRRNKTVVYVNLLKINWGHAEEQQRLKKKYIDGVWEKWAEEITCIIFWSLPQFHKYFVISWLFLYFLLGWFPWKPVAGFLCCFYVVQPLVSSPVNIRDVLGWTLYQNTG